MNVAFLILGSILSVLGLGYGIYLSIQFVKNKKVHELAKKDMMNYVMDMNSMAISLIPHALNHLI